jgi:hypothetical protein
VRTLWKIDYRQRKLVFLVVLQLSLVLGHVAQCLLQRLYQFLVLCRHVRHLLAHSFVLLSENFHLILQEFLYFLTQLATVILLNCLSAPSC